MKRSLRAILVMLLCLCFVLAAFACKGKTDGTEDEIIPTPDNGLVADETGNGGGTGNGGETESKPIDPNIYLNVLDPKNETGVASWTAIPLITQELLDAGFAGGESCQRLGGITRSESNPNLMFLGTDVGGLFKSTDDGKTWYPSFKGADRRGAGFVEIDPFNSSHLVMTSTASGTSSSKYFSAICYSFDEGETWASAAGTNKLGISAAHCYYNTLAFDRSSYDAELGYCSDVYYSTPFERDPDPKTSTEETAGLYKSTDGGKSFVKYSSQEKLYDGMMSITDGVVTLANQYGVFREENGVFVKKCDITGIESLKKVGSDYYILTKDGVYKSDESLNFSVLPSNNFPARDPRSLEISELDPSYMIISAKKSTIKYSERIYYSHDGGLNWTLVDLGKLNVPGMFFNLTWGVSTYSYNSAVPGEIVGTTSNTVIRSLDYGETWTISCDGIANAMVGGKFDFNVYNPDLVYMGIQDFGGAISTDGGKTWKKMSLSKDGDGKNIYGGYAADENTIIGVYTEQWADGTKRANERYVCFTHDGAQTVNVRKEDLTDPDKAEMLQSILICNKILTSYESSYQSPTNKNVLFCGNYRSDDYGYTWRDMLKFETPCLQVYTHCGKTLYGVALGEGYVLKSDDEGLTWQRVNETPLKLNENSTQKNHIIDVAVDGQNGYIYAIFCKKLYRMNIDGTNIIDLTKGMSKDNWGTVVLNSVAVDPNDGRIVYCGGSGDMYASDHGIRRSCDCGLTWQTVTPSLAPDSVVSGVDIGYETKCLRVHPVTGDLWNGTSCLGFSKLTAPYGSSEAGVKISYHLGYDNLVGVFYAEQGKAIADIYTPEREGYVFVGWFADEACVSPYAFGAAATAEVHLYAKWEEA